MTHLEQIEMLRRHPHRSFILTLWQNRQSIRHQIANDISAQILLDNNPARFFSTIRNLSRVPRAIVGRFAFLKRSYGYWLAAQSGTHPGAKANSA